MGEGGAGAGAVGWWVYAPPVWLAVNIALAAWHLVGSGWLLDQSDLPGFVAVFVYGGAVAALVKLLWGLFVLRLAWMRSPRFAPSFIAWQAAVILWVVAMQAYVLLAPDFSSSPEWIATAALEVAVGAFCIAAAARAGRRPPAAPAPAHAAAPSTLATILAGLLGLLAGAVLGLGAGLLVGALIADVTDMSCFEGACGFFAFFTGLFGLFVGAVAGLALAIVMARRRGGSVSAG